MGVVLEISKTKTVEENKSALQKLLGKGKLKQSKKLSDFYGKLKKTYGDALAYQKSVRHEWE